MKYDYDDCEQYKASGQCHYDDKCEECRKCSFKECLTDMASDLDDDMTKLIKKFGEETYEVVLDFIKKERKNKEQVNE